MKTKLTFLAILFFSMGAEAQVNFGSPNTFAVGDGPRSVKCGDFNNDGKRDIIVSNGLWTDDVSLLLGNGTGGFANALSTVTGLNQQGSALVAADLNNDGKLDVAVCHKFPGRVCVMLGNGAGGFGSPQFYPCMTPPDFIQTGYFNGDAFIDLAVTSGNTDVTFFFGSGNGGFGTFTPFTTVEQSYGITTADFNLDGKDDLAVGNGMGGKVTILLGNGVGGFTESSFAVGSQGYYLTASDFNGDGKADVAIVRGSYAKVELYLGDGTGGFTASGDYSIVQDAMNIVAADFNNDGKMDVATVSATAKAISILAGDGTGGFAATNDFSTGSLQPGNLSAADFNNDGKMDLVTTNSGTDDVCVLLNSTPTATAELSYYNDVFTVTPNPSAGQFFIDIPLTDAETAIEIYNCMGVRVYQQLNAGNHIAVDISDLPHGVYFIGVSVSGIKMTSRKIILQ